MPSDGFVEGGVGDDKAGPGIGVDDHGAGEVMEGVVACHAAAGGDGVIAGQRGHIGGGAEGRHGAEEGDVFTRREAGEGGVSLGLQAGRIVSARLLFSAWNRAPLDPAPKQITVRRGT